MGERKLADGWVRFEVPGRAPWTEEMGGYPAWFCNTGQHDESRIAVFGRPRRYPWTVINGCCEDERCIAKAGVFQSQAGTPAAAPAPATDGMPCARFDDSGSGIPPACSKCHWPERVHDNAGLIADLTAQLVARDAEIAALRVEMDHAAGLLSCAAFTMTTDARRCNDWLARARDRRRKLSEETMTPTKGAGNAGG